VEQGSGCWRPSGGGVGGEGTTENTESHGKEKGDRDEQDGQDVRGGPRNDATAATKAWGGQSYLGRWSRGSISAMR
jgi:hypothetical protein